ncbi:hypothetical protein [Mesorhizobium sp.]|uniref:hypothetical protein n=1 Tax=Mesorhizobium sp. TaxID=1871066 RepID=UPI00122A5F52|nr:hypothetical protein [Mesorhizobium sp.]TIO06190.1 MAG: hypothetical protein E5X88_23940 [Mesorhizobium sp.]TIO36115.1 MAG: hypothetical protein E5X89_04810 [Mesorhizobium sp.]TIP11115.1 MAG: hypothetical protein E5X73_18180 [Mesorhizobium sp.]
MTTRKRNLTTAAILAGMMFAPAAHAGNQHLTVEIGGLDAQGGCQPRRGLGRTLARKSDGHKSLNQRRAKPTSRQELLHVGGRGWGSRTHPSSFLRMWKLPDSMSFYLNDFYRFWSLVTSKVDSV